MTDQSPLKFLVVRRDNIGDLVCTTPMFSALRQHFPRARICALVNSYNVQVLDHNPDVDEVFAYTKAKHVTSTISVARSYWDRARLLAKLRGYHFDYAILPGSNFTKHALRLARFTKPRHIIGYAEPSQARHIDMALPPPEPDVHEMECVYRLLAPLGIVGPPLPQRVIPDPAGVAKVRAALQQRGWTSSSVIAIHISTRRPSNRWSEQHFIALIRALWNSYGTPFMLFWSPGDVSNPQHPGDDAKADAIMRALTDVPIMAWPTHELSELISGLSVCSELICSDGGAMHLASGLGKPILCFFGDTPSVRWHPWGVPYVLLQPESLNANDISVDEAVAAFQRLKSLRG
ncbi:MAG: glycosyltransferase family 9 protein [Gammaproteobacteria bacterium]